MKAAPPMGQEMMTNLGGVREQSRLSVQYMKLYWQNAEEEHLYRL